jgi:hypothetical protein
MTTAAVVLLSLHLAATAVMTGLIWFVQVVHYPLFAAVGAEQFVAYEVAHQSRTSLVVGLPMLVEGLTVLGLFFWPPDGVGRLLPFVGGVLLTVVLASTVFLQVPAHAKLAQSYDAAHVRRLVRTNWVRTIGWSARLVLAVVMLVVAA